MKRKLFATLLVLCMCLALLPTAVYAGVPNTYHTGDIAVINSIIANNHPSGMTQAPADGSFSPDDWKNQIYWDYSVSPRRVLELTLTDKDMTGTLDVSGLTALTRLECNDNRLTGLNMSGLTALRRLECHSNQLTELDLSSLTALKGLLCDDNQLTELDLSSLTALTSLSCTFNQLTGVLDVSNLPALTHIFCYINQLTGIKLNGTASYQLIWAFGNSMEDSSAVTGATIPWDKNYFMFDPQHFTITNILGNISNDNATTSRRLIDETNYTATLTADKGYTLPAEVLVRSGEIELIRDQDYTYNSQTGALEIFANRIRGDIEIEAAGVPLSTHSVTIEKEGSGTASASPIAGHKGTAITLSATPDSGWRFKEWQIVSGDLSISNNIFRMPDSDVVIKAIFEAEPTEATEPTETTEPTEATTPTEATKSTDATTPTEATKPTDPDQTLPKTGESMGTYLFSSLLLLAVAGLLLGLRKKRISKQRD